MPITLPLHQWFKTKTKSNILLVFLLLLLFCWCDYLLCFLALSLRKFLINELISISITYVFKNKKVTLYTTFPSGLPNSAQLMEVGLQVRVPTNNFLPRILQIFPAQHPMSIVQNRNKIQKHTYDVQVEFRFFFRL